MPQSATKLILCLVVVLFSWSPQVFAVPDLINYQGVLSDSTGTPVNGSVAMDFALYDAVTGGTRVWGESHPAVTVSGGIYHVLFGSGTPLAGSPPLTAELFANPDLWLQVTANSQPLTPRQRLASVPYSMQAAVAESVIDGAITGASIAPGSITATQLAPGTITPDKIAATCQPGETLMQTASGWACQPAVQVLPGMVEECYDGPLNTLDVGVCQRGVRIGTGTCGGQVIPVTRACNELDNDCDGIVECNWVFKDLSLYSSSRPVLIANFPQVVAANNGNALVIWEQGDENARDGMFKAEYSNGNWTFPSSLSEYIDHTTAGLNKNKQTAMNNNGDAVIIWPNNGILKAEYRGGVWTYPLYIDSIIPFSSGGYNPQVAMDDTGNTIITWLKSDGSFVQIFKAEFRDGVWTTPTALTDNLSLDGSNASYPQVAMDNSGNAIITWQQSDGSFSQIFKAKYRGGSWTTPTALTDNLSPDGSHANYPQVAMDNNGNAIIAWQQSDGSFTQIFKAEYRGGSWTTPTALTNNISPAGSSAINLQVAMDNNGNAIITWQQSDGSFNQIFKAEYHGGAWSVPTALTDNISPDGSRAIKPQVAMDNNNNAIITWVQGSSLNFQILKSAYRNGSWLIPTIIGSAGESSDGPHVAMSDTNQIRIVWVYAFSVSRSVILAELVIDYDGDTSSLPYDCNDNDPAIYPGAPETGGDGIDSNCDGLDYPDVDGDGFGSDIDCNDFEPLSFPGNPEVCDGLDNDCNLSVDDGLSAPLNSNQTGICSTSLQTCGGVAGWLDDYNSIIGYETIEATCDGIDNDCDGVPDEGCPTLIISEYTDTSAGGDSLEIYNVSANPVSTAGCQVGIYFNGSGVPSQSIDISGATLAPGETLVLCLTNVSTACQLITSQLQWSGNDSIVLTCPDGDKDAIGQVGSLPPNSNFWGTEPITTMNHTLRRKCPIVSGDVNLYDLFDPAVEWDGFPANDFSDLGQHCGGL